MALICDDWNKLSTGKKGRHIQLRPSTTDRHQACWTIQARVSAAQPWDQMACTRRLLVFCYVSFHSSWLLSTQDDKQVHSAVRLKSGSARWTARTTASHPLQGVGDQPAGSDHSRHPSQRWKWPALCLNPTLNLIQSETRSSLWTNWVRYCQIKGLGHRNRLGGCLMMKILDSRSSPWLKFWDKTFFIHMSQLHLCSFYLGRECWNSMAYKVFIAVDDILYQFSLMHWIIWSPVIRRCLFKYPSLVPLHLFQLHLDESRAPSADCFVFITVTLRARRRNI